MSELFIPEYPKVLIFGQPFNDFSGGGITLTNLFKGWPKERIAVTYLGHGLISVTTDVCDIYYQLGEKEHKWKFPFSLIQKKFRSGIKTIEKKAESSTGLSKKGLRYFIVNKFFYPILEWFGLFHCVSRIELSTELKKWLSEFKPEILYVQVATRETLLFAAELIDYLKVPSAIHNMDDWPSTISSKGLFRNYWKKKIDSEFKNLLNRIDLFLSISDAMSSEYRKRYAKEFVPFHNPIETRKFEGLHRREYASGNIFRILYLGRIGMANKEALYLFAKAVSGWKSKSPKLSLEIFTPDLESPDARKIRNLSNVNIALPTKHEEVPALLANSDLLLLPLDFNQMGMNYAQYSIPTKASEYMISGTTIMVFAPAATAISKFCKDNECALCLTINDKDEISRALEFLIENEEYRKKWAKNAEELARKLFDADIVRENFQSILIGLKDKG